MEDCEECTATLSFYVISGSDLSQVHMVVENLRVTRDIPDEGGCDRSITDRDTSDRRCEFRPSHDDRQRHLRRRCEDLDMSPSSDRLMTTGGDTSDGRCEDLDMSPSSDRLMTIDGDTSDGRCEDHDMSPSSDRLMTIGGDTSDGRCEGHDMSPRSDRPITTGEDTLEKV